MQYYSDALIESEITLIGCTKATAFMYETIKIILFSITRLLHGKWDLMHIQHISQEVQRITRTSAIFFSSKVASLSSKSTSRIGARVRHWHSWSAAALPPYIDDGEKYLFSVSCTSFTFVTDGPLGLATKATLARSRWSTSQFAYGVFATVPHPEHDRHLVHSRSLSPYS